jgi:tetratricopeptide (TPR) repeat protein
MADNLRYEGFTGWRALIADLEARIESTEDPAARARLWLRVATLRERHLGEQAEANRSYKEAYRADKQCFAALRRARRLLRVRGKLDQKLTQLFEIEFKAHKKAGGTEETSNGERAGVHLEWAWTQLVLGEEGKALSALKQALFFLPEDALVEGLIEDLAITAYDEDRADFIRAEAEEVLETSPVRAARHLARAGLFVLRTSGPAAAARADLVRAAALDPEDDTALLLLENRLLGGSATAADLERLYREVLDQARSEAERGTFAHQLAYRLLSQIEDPSNAVKLHEVAFEFKPDDERTFEFLTLFYRGRREAQRLRDVCARAAHAAPEPDAKVQYLVTGALLLAKEMGEERLADTLVALLRQVAADHPALAELSALGLDGRTSAAPQDVEAAAPEPASSEAAAPGPASSEAAAPEPASSEAAAPGPAAGVGPGVGEGHTAPDASAVDRTESPAAAASSAEPEAPRAERKMYGILDQDLPAEFQAAADEASAMEADKADRALAAWRKLLDQAPPNRAILAAIRRLSEATKRWNYLVDAYKKSVDRLPEDDAEERARLLFELADVYVDDMGQKPSALQPLQQAVQIAPGSVEAIDRLLSLFEQLNRPADHVKLLAQKAEVVADPQEKVDILLEVARLYQEKFRNVGEAIKAYQRVVEADPSNANAVATLKGIYESRRDWDGYVALALQEIDATDDPLLKVERTVALADLATQKIRKPDVCIDLWERVRSLDPTHLDAMKALAGLYDRAKEFAKLAEVLRLQLEAEVDPATRKELLLKLGPLFGDKIEDDGSSIQVWRQLMQLDPSDRRAPEQIKKRYLALQAWDDLEGFYQETEGRWDELIRLLEKEASSSGMAVEQKVVVHRKIARLWLEKLEKADRAAGAYEEVLKLEPSHRETAQALIPLYEQLGKPADLARVLEVELGHLEDPFDRYAALVRLGTLAAESLKNPSAALDWFARAFDLDPAQVELCDAMEAAAAGAARQEDLVVLYRKALAEGKLSDAASLRERTARLLDQALGRPEEALREWEAVLEADSQHADALLAIERIYTQMGRFEELLRVLEQRRSIAASAEEENGILVRIARVWEEALGNRDRAIDVYREVLEARGDDPEILRSLERLYESAERWKDLLEMVERRRMLESPGTEAYRELEFRLGAICQHRLGDAARAVECYRNVLEEDPGYRPAVEALEPLLADPGQRADVARILEGIFERAEDWANLVRVIEVLVEVADTVDERLGHLRRVAEIQVRRLAQPDQAFATQQRAFRVAPADEQVLADLDQLATVLDAWPALVRTLVDVVAHVEDRDVRLRLWLKVATVRETYLADAAEAIQAYVQALDADPGAVQALDALERLFEAAERYEELLDIYRRRVAVEQDGERKEHYFAQMAFLSDEVLNRPDDAVSCYRDILAFDPANRRALRALEGLFRRLERWAELADAYQRLLDQAETEDEGVTLKLALAELRRAHMENLDGAIDLYRDILEADPRRSEAVVALEGILQDAAHALTVARVLEPVYRQTQEFTKLIGVLEILVRHADEARERVDLLHQIAQLFEVPADDPEQALEAFVRALHEDPADETTLDQIERLARVLGKPERLVSAIEAEVEGLEDGELAVRLHAKAADVCEREIGDLERGIKHHRAVLARDAANLGALSALERVYATLERYADLAQVYLSKADVLQDPQEVKEQFEQAGRIFEEILERRDDAIGVFRRMLEFDAEDLRPVDKLIELYLAKQSWEDLLGLYETKSDLVQDVEEKKRILLEMGAVFRLEMKDREKAIDTYKRILELDPSDLQAIAQLDELYEETGSWHDLLHILEREAELAVDPFDVMALRFRAGRVWETHLDDVARAIEYYRGILEVNPEHQPSIDALEALMTSGREALTASAVLGPLYEAAGEWRKLIATLEVQIARSEDAWQRVDLLHRVAELYELPDRLNEPEAGFTAYAQAFRADPLRDRSLESIERLAALLDAWPRLAALYDEVGAGLEEVEAKVALGIRSARVQEEELGNLEEAIRRLTAVLEVDAENAQALRSLDRLYRAAGHWAELVAILRREEGVAESEEEALGFRFDRGQVLQSELSDPAGAIEAYREILEVEPQHAATRSSLELLFAEGSMRREVAAILEPIYQAAEEWEKLVQLLENKLDLHEVPGEKLEVIHRIAEILEARLGRPEEAFRWLGRGLLLVSEDERTAEELDRLAAMMMQGWENLAQVYGQILTTVEAAGVKLRAGRKLARICEDELGDAERGRQVWEHLLEVDPSDREVLDALDRIYQVVLDWENLAGVLARKVEVETSADEKVELLTRLGRLQLSDLGNPAAAEPPFRRIIDELGRDHLPALEGLEQIYGQTGEWTKLYDVYKRQVDAVLGEAAQSEVYAKMAVLASDALDRPDEAVGLWGRVLDIRGDEPEALRAIAGLYERLEKWTELAEALDRLVTIVEADADRVEVFLGLGQIRHRRLGNGADAIEAYRQVLYIDPDNVEALRRTAVIHAEAEAWEDLIETLNRLVDAGAGVLEPEELVAVHAQAARVYAERLDRSYDAIEAWRRVLAVDPHHAEALDRLEALLKQEERWEEVVEVLGQKIEILDDAEARIALHRETADIWKDRIGERDKGAPALEAILQLREGDEGTFVELVALYEEFERWDELVALYGRKYAELEGRAQARAAILARIGKIYLDKKDDPDSAYSVYKAAFLEDFTNRDVVNELERVAGRVAAWEDLLAAVSGKIAELGLSPPAIPLYLAAGQWYARQLKRLDFAVQTYATILGKIDPNNVDALLGLADTYREMKQWPALVQTLGRCIEVVDDPARKKEILAQLGETHEEVLGEDREAVLAFRKALDIDPEHPKALKALDRLYRRQERWADLVPILERRVAGESDGEKLLELKLGLAEVFEDRIGRADAAIKWFREALDMAPGNLRPLKGLERLYAKEERWQDLLDVLELELQVADSERERVALLERMASMLEEEFLRHEDAASRLEQVLQIDPTSENALNGLERLYRQLQRWDDLVDVYGRHVDASVERQAKVDHLKAQAVVFVEHLSDTARAVESYRAVLDLDPNEPEALDRLADLLEKEGDSRGSLDALERLAQVVVEDPLRQVDILTRVGTVLEKQMGDRAGAVHRFEQALAVMPEHLPAMAALREIYVDNMEWVLAARMLDREQAATPAERQRSRLLTQRGQILLESLENEVEALACFEQAVQLDPENEVAGEPLARLHMRDKVFDKAEPVLDMLLRRLHGKRTPVELRPLYVELAIAAAELGNTDKALKALRVAYQTDPSDLDVIRRIADLHYVRKEWDHAFKYYQMILVQHIDKLFNEDKVEIYHRLGNIKMAVKEVRKALNLYEKALDIESLHQPTLTALVELFEGQKDWEQVIHFKKQLAEAVPEADRRFELLAEVGDIWKDKVNNGHKAIQSYLEALEVRAEDRDVLVKLLRLYHETKQWAKAIEVCERVIVQETEPKRLSAYHQFIATTYRDEIKDADKAVDAFDKALDADPDNLKNFEAIEKILTPRRDWQAVSRAYRRMIKRLPDAGKELLKENLLHNLGEIARSRLKNYELASECFRLASEINPDNRIRHEILAELFAVMPGRWEDAVHEHQYLIRNDPKRVESYRALRRIYQDAGRADETWCVCAALAFLGKAEGNERQFFEQHRPKSPPAVRGAVTPESWYKHLYHHEENIYVSKIFEAITPAVRQGMVVSPKEFGLRKKDLQDPASSNLALAKALRDGSVALNIPLPDLYVIPEQAGGLVLAFTDPPSSVAGPEYLTGFGPMELRFVAAKHLSNYRREHYLQYLLQTTATQMGASLTQVLLMYLYAAVKVGLPEAEVPANDAVMQVAKHLQGMMGMQDRQVLHEAARRFIENPIKSIKPWMIAADLTGDRAGLLMCGDLATAAKMMGKVPTLITDLNPTQRIMELTVFAVSEGYFTLRKEMGIAFAG